MRGSEALWELAKVHNRESSFPMVHFTICLFFSPKLFVCNCFFLSGIVLLQELLDPKYLPSKDLRDWCGLNTKKPDILQDIPIQFFDLINKCLTVNPRSRISAEEALQHEFFAPCHKQLRKQRLLRQELSLDSKTALVTCDSSGLLC